MPSCVCFIRSRYRIHVFSRYLTEVRLLYYSRDRMVSRPAVLSLILFIALVVALFSPRRRSLLVAQVLTLAILQFCSIAGVLYPEATALP